jgi:hypothetical protein
MRPLSNKRAVVADQWVKEFDRAQTWQDGSTTFQPDMVIRRIVSQIEKSRTAGR